MKAYYVLTPLRATRILTTAALLMLTLPSWAETFRDDFDGQLSPLWEPVLGNWELKDNAYNGKGDGRLPGFSLLPFEVSNGLEIEVTAMDTGKGEFKNALIVFSYVDESEIYHAGSLIKRGLWAINRTTHGGWDDQAGWRDLALAAAPVASNRWYVMRVEIDNTTVRLSVDGEFKVAYTFKPKFPKGRIGLGASGADTLFDEFRVSGNVGGLPVHPKARMTTTWAKLKSDAN